MKKSNILLCCSLIALAGCSAESMNKFSQHLNAEMQKSDMKPINTASWELQDCNNWRNIGKSVQTAWQSGENQTRIYDRVRTHTGVNFNQTSSNDVVKIFKETVDMAFKVKMYDKQSDKDQVITTTGSNFSSMCNFYKRKANESSTATTSTTTTTTAKQYPSRTLKPAPVPAHTTQPARTSKPSPVVTTTQPARTLKAVPTKTLENQPSRTLKVAP